MGSLLPFVHWFLILISFVQITGARHLPPGYGIWKIWAVLPLHILLDSAILLRRSGPFSNDQNLFTPLNSGKWICNWCAYIYIYMYMINMCKYKMICRIYLLAVHPCLTHTHKIKGSIKRCQRLNRLANEPSKGTPRDHGRHSADLGTVLKQEPSRDQHTRSMGYLDDPWKRYMIVALW